MPYGAVAVNHAILRAETFAGNHNLERSDYFLAQQKADRATIASKIVFAEKLQRSRRRRLAAYQINNPVSLRMTKMITINFIQPNSLIDSSYFLITHTPQEDSTALQGLALPFAQLNCDGAYRNAIAGIFRDYR